MSSGWPATLLVLCLGGPVLAAGAVNLTTVQPVPVLPVLPVHSASSPLPLLSAWISAERSASPLARAQALQALARHLRLQQQPGLAVFLAKLASAEAPGSDLAALRELVGWLAEDGRAAEAVSALALLQAGEFDDYLADGAASAGLQRAAVPPLVLADAEQVLALRWAQASAGPADSSAAAALAQAQSALQDMATLLAGPAPTPRAFAPRREAAVRPGDLQVQAVAGADTLSLLLHSPQGLQIRRIAWPAAEQAQQVGAVLARIQQGGASLPPLQALYQRIGLVIDNAARQAGAQRIVLQLDGALRYLPFAALHDGRGYLGERYAFVQGRAGLPASGAALPTVPTAVPAPRLQALGVSWSLGGQPALPGVAREVCAIVAGPVHGLDSRDAACPPDSSSAARGIVAGEAWLNAQFTAQKLAEVIRRGSAHGRSLLHLGTHFDLRPGRIGRSSLVLGDGSRLMLADLANLSFEGHDLVTLSACETGLAGADPAPAGSAGGQEVDGLGSLILQRGARAVLASLWRVDDDSTSALMQAFYRALDSAEPAQALRLAQHAVRQMPAWQAPRFWAGFFLSSRH